jgi:hypothetical protein
LRRPLTAYGLDLFGRDEPKLLPLDVTPLVEAFD